MISLLLSLLVLALVVYVIVWIIGMIGLPEPARTIAMVIVAICVLVYLLRMLGVAV